MIVTITLTYVGANSGPLYDLYSDADGYVTPFATSVPIASLYPVGSNYTVSDLTTTIKLDSSGDCYPEYISVVTSTTTTTSSTTTTTTTTAIPEEIAMYLNVLSINETHADKLDFDLTIKNGTSSAYNFIVQVMNVTKGSGWVNVKADTSYANTVVTYTGTSASLLVTNSFGDTFDMRFSTDSGFSWTGTQYFGAPLILDYPV